MADNSALPRLVGDLYVCCTANLVTGGPELLHQLVHEVNASGGNAHIVYVPTSQAWRTPSEYVHYQCPVATTIPDGERTIVLVPEVMPAVLRSYQRARLVVWWLSVDNYTHPPGRWLARLIAIRRHISNDWYRAGELHHLAQSHYAKAFVAQRFGANAAILGDYIDPAFHVPTVCDALKRKPRIAFNPKKGKHYAMKLRAAIPEIDFVALENMSRVEVINSLRGSAIYIDLGNHPGKDRIPREAAACGCVVVVARRGSANYWEDVPLADEYKLDLNDRHWISIARETLLRLLRDSRTHRDQQANYLATIRAEYTEFSEGVRRIFAAA